MLESMLQRGIDRGKYLEWDRKVRLYHASLARQHWGELPWIGQVTTELAERMADGERFESVTRQNLDYITDGIWLSLQFIIDELPTPESHSIPLQRDLQYENYEEFLTTSGYTKPVGATNWAIGGDVRHYLELAQLLYAVHRGMSRPNLISKALHSVTIIRDIFGNPFRAIAFSMAWRTESVLSLARMMYDTRDFGAMPILADALQEAGCENTGILDHCRDPQQIHVRGCWVVDHVLGKE